MREPASGRRLLWPLALGTFLNPFNSTMVAVALVDLRNDFDLSVSAVTWIISAFYISSAAAQPVMGRLVDRLGPRRLSACGMGVVICGSASAMVAPSWGLLCFTRVIIAIGTATAFPSAVAAVERHVHPQHQTRGLALLQLATNVGAALGPLVGGLLLLSGSWRPIFGASIPLAAASLGGLLSLLPKDETVTKLPWRTVLRESDVLGVALFVIVLVTAMLSATGAFPGPGYIGAVLAAAAGVALVVRESRVPYPFLEFDTLVRNTSLMKMYGSWALLCGLYYVVVVGMPQLLEDEYGTSSAVVGFLISPIAALAIVANPIASRLIAAWGVRRATVTGSVLSVAACAACAAIAIDGSAGAVLAASSLLGLSSGVLAVALAQGMYQSATPETIGVAAGLFQTSRYVGALAAAIIIGAVFVNRATITGWLIAIAIVSVGSLVALGLLRSWKPTRS
jgi:MFS family permease